MLAEIPTDIWVLYAVMLLFIGAGVGLLFAIMFGPTAAERLHRLAEQERLKAAAEHKAAMDAIFGTPQKLRAGSRATFPESHHQPARADHP